MNLLRRELYAVSKGEGLHESCQGTKPLVPESLDTSNLMLTATYGIPPRHGAVLSDTLRALGCITVELHVGTGCV